MENSNGLSTIRDMSQTGKDVLPSVDRFLCVPPSHVPSFSIQSGCKLKPVKGSSHYQRCSSERFLIEEQPCWLDDLLDDSEPVGQKYHRRTASDTYAYLDKSFDKVLNGSPSNLQTNGNPLDLNLVSFNRNPTSFGVTPNKTLGQTSESSCGPKEDKVEKPNQLGSSYQNHESHGEKNDNVQSTCVPKADNKRAKTNRQSANRSRVRKLQYIAELERNVQALQAEGSGFVAEMEFRDQHNLILSMENRTLRQRLDNLSHGLFIKRMEHEMLEREIGRMQALVRLQMCQQEAPTPQRTALLKR